MCYPTCWMSVLCDILNVIQFWPNDIWGEKRFFFTYWPYEGAISQRCADTDSNILHSKHTHAHARSYTDRHYLWMTAQLQTRTQRETHSSPAPHARNSQYKPKGRMHGYENNHKPCNEQSALLRSVPLRKNTILHLEAVEKQSWLGWKLFPLYSAGEFKVQVIKVRCWSAFSSDCQSAWGVMVGPPPTPPAECPAV